MTTRSYAQDRETITDALTRTTIKDLDADGSPVRITDALGRVTTFTYDKGSLRHGEGRPVRTDLPDQTFTTITYDGAGRKLAETDQDGKTTSFAYDTVGRLHTVTDPLQHTSTFGYDEVGNRTSITDPNGRTTSFEYDRLGRMTRRTLPGGQFESFVHDASGNVVTHRPFNGIAASFWFDAENRMYQRAFPGEGTETFTYSALGRRLTARDETFTYDARGRLLTNRKGNGDVLSYTYDAAGNRTGVTGPHGTTDTALIIVGSVAPPRTAWALGGRIEICGDAVGLAFSPVEAVVAVVSGGAEICRPVVLRRNVRPLSCRRAA